MEWTDSVFMQRPMQGTVPFIWIYQSQFQHRLMQRYGKTVICMDSTYKTQRYGYPLFTL
jgi:hypothetical protein